MKMLKQYQNPTFTVVFAETEDVLTLSLNTSSVHGIGGDRTYSFENSEIWTTNNS